MKKFRYIVPFLLCFSACRPQENSVGPEPELVKHTLYASTPVEDEPEMRTIVSPFNEKNILWSPNESISILSGGGNYLFKGDNETAVSSASFTGMGPADLGSYIALYPYNASASYDGSFVSTSLPAIQTGRNGSFADGYLVTADDATGSSISFNHVCSGIRFVVNSDRIRSVSIRGNNGEKIAGDFRFSFTAEDTPVAEAGTDECVTLTAPGGRFETGTYYYIVILPTEFSKGFTLIADDGSEIGEFCVNSSVSFSPGVFKNVTGRLDDRMTWAAPKVYYGQQNSFCMRPGGSVSFDVSPRLIEGTWQRGSVPALADVPDGTEVLWGDATASLSGSTLTLTAAATEGSSLVAIKKGGTILWSYLIWVTAEEPTGNVLPPLGGQLYFQWGRKDPLTESSAYAENKGADGLAYSISHPCDFIDGGHIYDWFTDSVDPGQDDTLWGEGCSKTVWDPCPSGYRVPSITDNVPGTSFNYGYLYTFGNWILVSEGDMYWTRDIYEDSMSHQSYYSPGSSETESRYIALPVRCVKE